MPFGICRLWFNAPFVMLGLWDERQDVRVPLFQNYKEQALLPFVVFRATLQVVSHIRLVVLISAANVMSCLAHSDTYHCQLSAAVQCRLTSPVHCTHSSLLYVMHLKLQPYCDVSQTAVVTVLQPRAGGGHLPQLYEAKVHLRLRLGMLARLFYLVSILPPFHVSCAADYMHTCSLPCSYLQPFACYC